jgi:hypothetical protein
LFGLGLGRLNGLRCGLHHRLRCRCGLRRRGPLLARGRSLFGRDTTGLSHGRRILGCILGRLLPATRRTLIPTCGTLITPLGPCGTLLSPLGPYGTLVSPLGPCGTLVSPLGPCGTLVSPLGLYGTLVSPLGLYGTLVSLLGLCGTLVPLATPVRILSTRIASTTSATTLISSPATSVSSAATTTPTTAAVAISVLSIRVDVPYLEVLGRDGVGEVQGLSVVEAHPVLPRVACEDRDNGVLGRCAATHLDGVLLAPCEVQEATTSGAQTAPGRALCVAAAHPQVELLRRLAGLTRIDLDRVPVEGTDLAVDDLVPRTITGLDGLGNVLYFNVLVQLLAEGIEDILQICVAEFVDLHIELVRLVAEHVGEFAGQTLVGFVLAHGCMGASWGTWGA